MIFTFVMALLLASILGWSITEYRFNVRTAYLIEAHNAAEAVSEYGAAQVEYLASNISPTPSMDPASGQTVDFQHNPLQLPFVVDNSNTPFTETTTSFFNPNTANGTYKESHVDTQPLSAADPNGLEVIGGQPVTVTTSGNKNGLYYVDPNQPQNVGDPFAYLSVKRTDYQVLAKATVVPPDGQKPVTAYAREIVSVRAAPIFDWAIFYGASDLEVYPGVDMVVTGPVHANYNLLVSPTGATLTFLGPVTTTGNIFHAQENSTDHQTALTNDSVFFSGKSGPVNMYSSNTWYDSSYGTDTNVYGSAALNSLLTADINTQFAKYVANHWPNNVMTPATQPSGVMPPFNPQGFSKPLADGTDPNNAAYTADTEFVDNGVQFPLKLPSTVPSSYKPPVIGSHIILSDPTSSSVVSATGNVSDFDDPPDSDFPKNISPSDPTSYYQGRKGLEDVKYANLANLYILVTEDGSGDVFISYYGPYDSREIGTAGYGPNGGVGLGSVEFDSTGAPIQPPHGAPFEEPTGLLRFVPYATDSTGTYVTHGLYDQRQKASVDLIEFNMAALKTALTDVNTDSTTGAIINNSPTNPNGGSPATIWGSGIASDSSPKNGDGKLNDNTAGFRDGGVRPGGWNGTIYVDVEIPPTASHQVALALDNGQTALPLDGVTGGVTNNLVPNDLNSDGSQAATTTNDPTGLGAIVGPTPVIPGLTIATNAPVYIVGNFNATGSSSATSSTRPDDENRDLPWTTVSQEAPVSIIGDAVTLLSPYYFGKASSEYKNTLPPLGSTNDTASNAYNSKNTLKPKATANSEVAIGMIAGLVRSSPEDASGGVNNLPRFLEDWGGKTQVFRGSLVNMFDSKIANQPFFTYPVSARYFEPPTRDWGYDELFGSGVFPPSTPYTYEFYRLDFTELPSASDYTNWRTDKTWGWPNDTFQPVP
jgi:hypothetical protein